MPVQSGTSHGSRCRNCHDVEIGIAIFHSKLCIILVLLPQLIDSFHDGDRRRHLSQNNSIIHVRQIGDLIITIFRKMDIIPSVPLQKAFFLGFRYNIQSHAQIRILRFRQILCILHPVDKAHLIKRVGSGIVGCVHR